MCIPTIFLQFSHMMSSFVTSHYSIGRALLLYFHNVIKNPRVDDRGFKGGKTEFPHMNEIISNTTQKLSSLKLVKKQKMQMTPALHME